MEHHKQMIERLRVWAENDVMETARDGTFEYHDAERWRDLMLEAANLFLSQAQEIERLRKVLTHIAAYDDELAAERLAKTGSYGAFDEPGSIQTTREAIDGDQL